MNIIVNLFWTFFPHILPCPWISGFFSLQLTFFSSQPQISLQQELGNQNEFFSQNEGK